MNEQTVARLLNFKKPLNETELARLEEHCQKQGFGTNVKGKQFHLTLPEIPRRIEDSFLQKIESICIFLETKLGRSYKGDTYEVDY